MTACLRVCATFILIWGIALPAGAAAPLAAQRLERGRVAMTTLDYDVAADEFMLVAADPAATEGERLEANLLAGQANRILGRNVEARLNFLYVLTNAPHTQLPPGTAPKVTSFFELVRQEARGKARSEPTPAPVEPAVVPKPVLAATLEPTVNPESAVKPEPANEPVEVEVAPETKPAMSTDTGDDGRSVLSWSVLGGGGMVAAGGVALIVLGGGTLAGMEATLGTATGSKSERSLMQWAGRGGAAIMVVGGALCILGVGAATAGLVLE